MKGQSPSMDRQCAKPQARWLRACDQRRKSGHQRANDPMTRALSCSDHSPDDRQLRDRGTAQLMRLVGAGGGAHLSRFHQFAGRARAPGAKG